MENENKFITAIEKDIAWKRTENGQPALNTTYDKCLDLFSTIGALRHRSAKEVEYLISNAYNEDPLTTIKILFYARDIEQGLGERDTFRIGLKYIANFHTSDIFVNLGNIVKFGRFDDLYCLVDTPAEKAAFGFMTKVFKEDLENMLKNKPITLAAKWLKSINTSSKESNRLGLLTAKAFDLSPKQYRKALSKMRAYSNILEEKMSANRWEEINFNNVPGGAMKKYTQAFRRHQEERFAEYIDAVKNNRTIITADGKEEKAKMNTRKLYPYEIIGKYVNNHRWSYSVKTPKEELEVMWNNLNNWLEGVQSNTVIMADTSGSMYGQPMDTSVGLAIYFAERNTGPFHNKFMTFSSYPTWISLKDGQTLAEKINVVSNADWGSCTNIEAAFDLILDTAKRNKLAQEDLPKTFVIITDMEFNQCVINNQHNVKFLGSRDIDINSMSFYDGMKEKYNRYGYELPEIVFWNCNARNNTFHTSANTHNVRMVSGQATSVFKSLIDGKTHTPYEFMLEVVYQDRYDSVVLAK